MPIKTVKTTWKGIQPPTENALTAAIIVIEGQVKEMTPIKTGRLKGSITWKVGEQQSGTQPPAKAEDKMSGAIDENEAYVGTNVSYGLFVEDGTSKQRPQSYLMRGAEIAKDAAFKAYENEMKKGTP
jgi:hypothetical protein